MEKWRVVRDHEQELALNDFLLSSNIRLFVLSFILSLRLCSPSTNPHFSQLALRKGGSLCSHDAGGVEEILLAGESVWNLAQQSECPFAPDGPRALHSKLLVVSKPATPQS